MKKLLTFTAIGMTATTSAHATGLGWFGHTILSSIIHGAVYGTLYHLFKSLGLGGAVMISVALLAVSWLIYRAFR
jgi:ABC-type sulfate transport system permease component